MAINFNNIGFINNVKKDKEGKISALMTTSVKDKNGKYTSQGVFVSLNMVKKEIQKFGRKVQHDWGTTFDTPLCNIEGFAAPWYNGEKGGVNWIVTKIELYKKKEESEDNEDDGLPF